MKEINHLIYSIFFCLGIKLQAEHNADYVNNNIKKIIIAMAFSYFAIQLFSLLILKMNYGTVKNPHYLAQYLMLLIPVSIFLLNTAKLKLKLAIVLMIFCLIGLLLHTNSRPAWLSLILTVVGMSFYHKHKLVAFGSIVFATIFLWITNIGNFSGQLTKLFEQITTEERVYIWHDVWKLIEQSNIKQWLFGHGLHSYEVAYKELGPIKMQTAITFNSPHNFFLVLLYTTGLTGLICAVLFYSVLYIKLFQTRKNSDEYKNLTSLLITLLTMNLLFVSIIVPIFSSFHLLITALVFGILLHINKLIRANR